jgi:hypothetical protein
MNSFEICEKSLRANILTLPSGKFVTAGQNQFLTLWTRDFCHAVRGLLLIAESEVAKNHLTYLLKSLRSDGLVPRVVDNHLVQFRVSWQSARKLCGFLPKLAFREPLKPQYTDEHGSNAIDSNLLVILASFMLKDDSFLERNHKELQKVLDWYDDKFQEGLIWQNAFSDWQDSVKREGHSFLTNLFYFLGASRMKEKGFIVKRNLEELKQKIHQTFFKDGLYQSMEKSPIISLEGNLFAIEAEEFLSPEEKLLLWKKLVSHPLCASGFGMCSYPAYPASDTAWHVKFAQLQGYHDKFAWSWLMGLGLKVSLQMNDKQMIQRQRALIEKVLQRDQVVMELYDPEEDWSPWKSWLLESERPFAWGSGYLIEALSTSG